MTSTNDRATETSDSMTEAALRTRAKQVLERVQAAVDAQDPDVVEAVVEADVLKLQFPQGAPFVLNMQPPLREIWLAAERQGWHFRFDGERWLCKKSGDELFQTLVRLVRTRAGVSLAL